MSQFLGIARHEFTMSIRRPGLWIAYALLYVFYGVSIFSDLFQGAIVSEAEFWEDAGFLIFICNMFMVLLAGILSADRMERDYRTGVRELQRSTSLSTPKYILAKYLGVLASVLVPMLAWVLFVGVLITIVVRTAPIAYLIPLLLGFLIMGVPAHAFVVVFSLACPMVMPLRVYQILFTGYWFWGNYISPEAFPTISNTLLNASGQIALQVIFGNQIREKIAYGAIDVVLNLLVLAGCAGLALYILNRTLQLREKRS